MPELTGIVSVISSVGFPIVAAIVMFLYIKYVEDKHREELKEVNSQHKSEMEEVTSAIQNNTLVMQKLVDTLTMGGSYGKHSDNSD